MGLGVAVTKARAVRQQLEGVLRILTTSSHRISLMVAALAFVPSSGAQHQLPERSDRRANRLKRWHSCHRPVLHLLFLTDETVLGQLLLAAPRRGLATRDLSAEARK